MREEVAAALGMVLGSATHPADDGQVMDFIRFAGKRGINTAGVWLADVGGMLAWAVLPIVSPGRTMLLLGPSAAPAHPALRRAAGELVDAVCIHFAGRNVQLAQVLIDAADTPSNRLYETRAFERVAELIYLQAVPRRKAPAPALPPDLQWVGYDTKSHAAFSTTIAETYWQSLDCPRLNGLRDMEDVLAGHKATGEFDPELWKLLCERDAAGARPLGALLLARAVPADTIELVYLGLTPTARGRGLGDFMMRQAMHAAAADASRLSLAVDSGNQPALKLYYRHGMQRVGAKLAMMRQLGGAM